MHATAQYVRPDDNRTPSPPSANGNAQQQPPPPSFWDKVSVGGSFQLQFGTYTYVGLEPLLNYHISNSFMIGIGPIYQYISINDPNYGTVYKSSIYGGRIAGMFFLPGELSRIFIMGEFDIINLPEIQQSVYGYYETRGNLEIPLLGLGYKEPVTEHLFFTIYALWDFSNSPYSPYSNPLINAGFDVGI